MLVTGAAIVSQAGMPGSRHTAAVVELLRSVDGSARGVKRFHVDPGRVAHRRRHARSLVRPVMGMDRHAARQAHQEEVAAEVSTGSAWFLDQSSRVQTARGQRGADPQGTHRRLPGTVEVSLVVLRACLQHPLQSSMRLRVESNHRRHGATFAQAGSGVGHRRYRSHTIEVEKDNGEGSRRANRPKAAATRARSEARFPLCLCP